MRTQRWTLVVVCVATAMLMLDIAVVNTALSRIAEDLGTGLSGLQWVVDAYTLALASVVLTAGSLADRLGRRRMFIIGLSLFTVASGACALALLAQAFPSPKERAGALAAYGATIGASFAVGPLVGGLLTSGLDWQWIFLINIPIGIACLAITRAYVEESRDPSAHGIDWYGQVTPTAGLGLLVLAPLRGNEDGWGSTLIIAELSGAAVALIAFVIGELRIKQPMLPMRFFRSGSFTGAQITAFAISSTFFAIFLYVTIYLQQILGLSAIEAGLVYLPGTLVMLVVTDSSWPILMPGFIVASIGTGLFNPALTNVALSSVPQEQSGVAAGVNDTARQAGIAVGVAALGALIPAEHAFGGNPAEYVSGMHDALLVGGIFAAIGALAGWFLISSKYGAAAEAPVEEETQATPQATLRPALDAA